MRACPPVGPPAPRLLLGLQPRQGGAVQLPSPLLRSLPELSRLDPDPPPETPSLGRQSRRHTPPTPAPGPISGLGAAIAKPAGWGARRAMRIPGLGSGRLSSLRPPPVAAGPSDS